MKIMPIIEISSYYVARGTVTKLHTRCAVLKIIDWTASVRARGFFSCIQIYLFPYY